MVRQFFVKEQLKSHGKLKSILRSRTLLYNIENICQLSLSLTKQFNNRVLY